jgi:hypothetical protein
MKADEESGRRENVHREDVEEHSAIPQTGANF